MTFQTALTDHPEGSNIILYVSVLLHDFLQMLLLGLGDFNVLQGNVHPQLLTTMVQEIAQIGHIPEETIELIR